MRGQCKAGVTRLWKLRIAAATLDTSASMNSGKPANGGPGTKPAKEGCVTLHYRTGWASPLVHLSEDDGGSWRQTPFLSSRTSPIGPDFQVVTLPAPPLRFVLTDGADGWDNPSPECDERYFRRMPDGDNYLAPTSGDYVLFNGKLTKAEGVMRRKGLSIVTDIDGTLFGCHEGLDRLNEIWCRELALSGAFLVYNTGRSVESVVALIRENRRIMPVPLATVTRVGGCVHWFRGVGSDSGYADADSEWINFDVDEPFLVDETYRKQLVEVEGWDEECIPFCRKVLNSLMEDGTQATWLYDGAGDPGCVQICVSIHVDSIDEAMVKLRKELEHLPIKFISSGSGDYRYLDLTVSSGGKLGGTKYVVSKLPGESGELENVVFCGDSGNDIDALLGDVKGVVVGNAQPDLLLAHETLSAQPKPSAHKVLITESGFASGILEGVKMHGFL